MTITRSQFLWGATGAVIQIGAGCGSADSDAESENPISHPLVDFHVHLFGIGDGGTGCYMPEKQKRHMSYRYLTRLLGLSDNGHIDQQYLERLVEQIQASSVDKAVLVAQDCRYDSAGRPDLEATSFFVPNDYLLQVTTQYPELFVPCISVNPVRRDAVDELEKFVDQGARVLKIHPPTQNVDPGEERFRPFFRRCAETGIIVMVHTGTEHSAEIVGDDYSDPLRLIPALEEGCTVVASHSGSRAFFDREDFFAHTVELVDRFPDFYCDTSIMASMFRWRTIRELVRTPTVAQRAIHASDFPFPSNAVTHWNQLSPRELIELASERNLLDRDFRLKRALGLPVAVFQRGAQLLSGGSS